MLVVKLPVVIWHGTEAEAFALLDAAAHHCVCRRGPTGELVKRCATHRALLEEQGFNDGVLSSRRRAEELVRQEFLLPIEPA